MATFQALLVLNTLLDAALGAVIVFAIPGRRAEGRRVVGALRLLIAAAAMVLSLAIKIGPLHILGLSGFGAIHLAWLDLVLVTPALAAGVLLRARLSRGRWAPTAGARLLAWTALALIPVAIWARWVEPFRLELVEPRVPLAEEREGREPLRIGVLADIQCPRVTDYEIAAVERLMSLEPDLILLPGDLVQCRPVDFAEVAPGFRDLLSRLSAPGGVYLVFGNVERRDTVEILIRGTEVELLYDRSVAVRVRDRRVRVGGMRLSFDDPEPGRVIRELEAPDDPGEVRILMAHRPDAVYRLASRSRVDLLVCGHTHGGQVAVPFLGPPLTLSSVPRRVAAGGLSDLDGRRVYVSRGVGCERGQAPRIRFLVRPEITLITLGG